MKQKWLLTGTALMLAAALAGCGNTPAADQTAKISMEQAQTAALDAANIEAADADISSATLSEVAGITCYKVEFTSGDYTYAYSINAESGEVLEASYRDKNAAPADSTQTDTTASGVTTTPAQTTPNTNTSTGAVDEAKAQEAALDAANIEAADADISSATLSEVAGVTCYKVEFTSGDHTYSYSINAESGEVLEASYRDKTVAPVDSTQTDATASGVTTTPAQTAPNTSTSSSAVDEAKAQEIALAHAGVNAADTTITKSKLDYDDGRQVYEIEWYANGAKYDYEVAVATGEIVNSGYEAKTVVGTGNSATVSEATAKQTALARVSGATEKDIYEWKLDYDDGRPEYEGKIIYDGSEYEFTIDATTGAVLEWEAETTRK